MRPQARLGDVDFITRDYLAEVNITHAAGRHPEYELSAWEGIEQTVNLPAEKRIKVINGGARNPKG